MKFLRFDGIIWHHNCYGTPDARSALFIHLSSTFSTASLPSLSFYHSNFFLTSSPSFYSSFPLLLSYFLSFLLLLLSSPPFLLPLLPSTPTFLSFLLLLLSSPPFLLPLLPPTPTFLSSFLTSSPSFYSYFPLLLSYFLSFLLLLPSSFPSFHPSFIHLFIPFFLLIPVNYYSSSSLLLPGTARSLLQTPSLTPHPDTMWAAQLAMSPGKGNGTLTLTSYTDDKLHLTVTNKRTTSKTDVISFLISRTFFVKMFSWKRRNKRICIVMQFLFFLY